jgi:hypothetical protein
MRAEAALLTDAAKLASAQTLSEYSAGVFAHITGDWGGHNVSNVYEQPFNDYAGHTCAPSSLRLEISSAAPTEDVATAEIVVILPATPTGASTLTSVPIITLQPQSQSVVTGTTVRFVVGAISDTSMTYQWSKGVPGRDATGQAITVWTAISGATAVQLVLPKVTGKDAGNYAVTVSNAHGSAASAAATLVVVAGSIRWDQGGDGFDIIGLGKFLLFPPGGIS